VLDREHHTAWLAPATPVEDLQAILRVDFAGISTYEISTYVNKPEHNDAQCIQPAEATG
jgi:putative SOS response-associated peptidase YedK